MTRRSFPVALGLSLLLLAACAAPAPISSPTTGTISPSLSPSSATPGNASAPSSHGAASPGSTSPPGVANADRPLTANELADVLVAVQATGDSATVVADVSLTPVHEACEAPSPCPFGTITLPGIDPVPVTADEDLRAIFPSAGANQPITGPLALQLGADVAWLGAVRPYADKLAWPVGDSAIPTPDAGEFGTAYAVRGWLTQTSFPCPTEPPLPTDSPFDPCGHSFVMEGASDASNGPPRTGIAVQRSAYATFAGPTAGGPAAASFGVYVIRQVKDPRASCSSGCYGWLMVGRLDPIQ
jgi:hypothetical protein